MNKAIIILSIGILIFFIIIDSIFWYKTGFNKGKSEIPQRLEINYSSKPDSIYKENENRRPETGKEKVRYEDSADLTTVKDTVNIASKTFIDSGDTIKVSYESAEEIPMGTFKISVPKMIKEVIVPRAWYDNFLIGYIAGNIQWIAIIITAIFIFK